MIAATQAAFATGLYLGGSVLFECPAEPVGWGLAIFFSLVRGIDLFWPSPIRVVMPGRTAYRRLVAIRGEIVIRAGAKAARCWPHCRWRRSRDGWRCRAGCGVGSRVC